MQLFLRRAAAVRGVNGRHSRNYTTPSVLRQQPDPQLDGYPQLPDVSRQYLPPKGWWDNQMRQNFGDTLHEQEELYSMWGPDVPVVPPQSALRQFTLVTLGFISFGLFVKHALVPDVPAVRREYPYSGLVTELGGVEENKARPEDEGEED